MRFYKIIVNKEIKGVVNSLNFFIENLGKLISSTDELGQFTEYNGSLYRDDWMAPIPNNQRIFTQASISEISGEDYFAFLKAKETNEVIIDDDEEETQPDIPDNHSEDDIEPDVMLEYIRSSKLTELSHACRAAIESGIDLELHGETHHFSLTTQDQLNLMSLSATAQTQDLIPYHADGELYTYYTAAEINSIIKAANDHKVYHTAYYNSLKAYVNALTTIEEIAAVTYGTEVPDEYKSDVLRVLE